MEEYLEYEQNTVLTFIDILGFKSMIIEKPLRETKKIIEEFIQNDNSRDYDQISKINTKFISDSLVVWMKLESPKDVTSYMVYIGSLIARIHKIGKMFVRGCMSYGKHYNDERIWISPVFIEAYSNEKKAIFPRILILNNVQEAIDHLIPGFLSSIWAEKDEKGDMFLNYMNFISGAYYPDKNTIIAQMNHNQLIPSLNEHKTNIETALNLYPSFKNKYEWLAKMHNDYIDKHINIKNKELYKVNVINVLPNGV